MRDRRSGPSTRESRLDATRSERRRLEQLIGASQDAGVRAEMARSVSTAAADRLAVRVHRFSRSIERARLRAAGAAPRADDAAPPGP
jgi:hypothetical protein